MVTRFKDSIRETCEKHKINWKWVKAHAGNKMNNLVDKLAVLKTK